MLAGGNGELGGGRGVGLIVGQGGDELGHPTQLVPGQGRRHQQRRIALEHPFQTLEQGAGVRPHLGIRGRQLPAIGVRSLHARVTVAVDDGDAVAGAGQSVGAGHAGDAAADDGDMGHKNLSLKANVPNKKRTLNAHPCASNDPLCLEPERFALRQPCMTHESSACSCGGPCDVSTTTLQSASTATVLGA